MKKIRNIAVLLLVAAAMIVGLSATAIGAADHLDAPLIQNDGRTDINDTYAFTNGDNTVLVMTVNPLAGVLNGTALRPNSPYEFLIDNDGDYVEDVVYRVQAGQPDANGIQNITLYDVGALIPVSVVAPVKPTFPFGAAVPCLSVCATILSSLTWWPSRIRFWAQAAAAPSVTAMKMISLLAQT